ncbi:MAG: magnesium transporter [Candidatus Eisenbacteria bacterium]|nr:magnesium transporter [Candidatus Eisenbacteria bacterium]
MPDRADSPKIALDAEAPVDEIVRALADRHPADIAAVVSALPGEKRREVLAELPPDTVADVMADLDEHAREDVLEVLPAPEIAGIVAALPSDDAADIIGALDDEKRAQVLAKLETEDRRDVERLLRYTDESAGGIMASEFVFVGEDETVDRAIEMLRAAAAEMEEIHYLYVTDSRQRLKGVVPLQAAALARPGTRVSDVMIRDVVTVTTEMDQEDVADVFRRYDLVAIPVVDGSGVLVGRITVDDIMDVIHEEAEEDISLMAGTREEELHEESVLRVSRIRLPWLVIGALGGLGSATVMRFFQFSLERVLALAFFVPVITAMGGNVGLQTSTIIVRGMRGDTGLSSEAGRRLLREWRIALTNAVILGVSVHLIVGFWLGDWGLALVVGGSLATVILVAATLGTVMPFALRSAGVDPAVAQGPFVTTLNDIIGILVYLGLASAFIERLS